MSDHRRPTDARTIRCAVLTVSDRCSRGESTDASGPALEALVRSSLGATISLRGVTPDEPEAIRAFVREAVEAGADLVLTTGGTGFGPRDLTPEAIGPLLERRADNLMELARFRCLEITPFTYLSRGIAGTVGASLVVALPGSPRGATETLEGMLDLIPHAIDALRGEEDHA